MNYEVSIIVRTHNEEKWIAHCLRAIFSQKFNSFEVIVVDNNSTDYTINIARRFPVTKIINIKKFIPGKAINDGINESNGKYLVCISAHCVPKDVNWLSNLYKNFVTESKIAGVYGRQLPLPYTSDADKRDLLITFGKDKKIQIKDYFFHNANSMFPREIWRKYPFDENATNIEDRIWGKQVIDAGFKIVYEPSAEVYHHHGLHQHDSSSSRAQGIARILDTIEEDSVGHLPSTLKPENINVAAILLINHKVKKDSLEFKSLLRSVNELKQSSNVDNIFILANDNEICSIADAKWIDRNKEIFQVNGINPEKLLSLCLKEIEKENIYPEVILYVNHNYPFRPKNLFNDLIHKLQFMGLSSAFPCFVDYGHYWKKNDNAFIQIDSSMDSRDSREPIMRALYGLGCATSTADIRSGSITGDNIGIISIENYMFTLNLREKGSEDIINPLL